MADDDSTFVDKGRFFKHYGIPGMKWGKRRVSSIAAARKEAERVQLTNPVTGEPTRAKYPKTASSAHIVSREALAKKRHELSNEEIQQTVTRLNLEKQLSQIHPTAADQAKKTTGRILGQVGNTVLSTVINQTIKSAVKAGLEAAGVKSEKKSK